MATDAAVIPTHVQPRVTAYPANFTGIKEPATAALCINSIWEWRWL